MTLADTAAAARSVGRPPATIRTWAARGLLTRHSHDGHGRTLYDLDEVTMTDSRQRAVAHFGQDVIDEAAAAIMALPEFRSSFAGARLIPAAATFAEAALAAAARQSQAQLDNSRDLPQHQEHLP